MNELKLLKEALKDYKKALKENNEKNKKESGTYDGFCLYFNRKIKDYQFNDRIKEILPTLYKQKPSHCYKYFMYCSPLWWKQGSLKPRIKALEKAINELENKK